MWMCLTGKLPSRYACRTDMLQCLCLCHSSLVDRCLCLRPREACSAPQHELHRHGILMAAVAYDDVVYIVFICRYVNGADPNRRYGSYRNLSDMSAGGVGPVVLDPILKDWKFIQGMCHTCCCVWEKAFVLLDGTSFSMLLQLQSCKHECLACLQSTHYQCCIKPLANLFVFDQVTTSSCSTCQIR